MKIVIVGGVAGGATTAARLRRLDENAEIILFERGNHISFANCGLPYYIGDVIKEKEELLLQTPKSFKKRFNIEVRVKQEVIKLKREDKKVEVQNKENGEIYEETYDKLVLAPGAEPMNPFPKSTKIKTLRNVEDAVEIKKYINENRPKEITIIGGGYIGVELAENLSKEKDLRLKILERNDHLIAPLDQDMANFVHTKLNKNGIEIILKNGVQEVKEIDSKMEILLQNGNKIESDLILLCMGVIPETNLAIRAGIKTNEKGSIIVNEWMQTNDENVYALGDAVQVNHIVTESPSYIPLAGPANRQARVVANHICNRKTSYLGSLGSSILKIFDCNLGITGINESICIRDHIPYKVMIISPYSHATYYPGATQMTIKALYDPKTGKILGAQVWGKESVDKITDILATAIRMKMTAYDLEELELCYAPPFSSAKSPVNILGNSIENEIEGLVENITWKEVMKLEDPYILDVRTNREYENSHLEKAVLIPLDELRTRLEELPKERMIYIHCHTGLRSYIACRILSQNGFQVKNIIGGYYFYKKAIEPGN
ncbi:MAG TPA: FAD-dependent oxidoreductase [Candidatus Merdicola faecigallinarum]|uniref:FAD-dependent oxidoreductase n=1 Tax=Candidatus Merdicola faecigallinarum TaxID=2840862 RepID=A0A9D1M1U3_9FIRM|nr:FAD-dependent oxidoreductase [Candidatus Merdicola faecigallinarum]